MFAGRSNLFCFVVLSSALLSLSQAQAPAAAAAANSTAAPANSTASAHGAAVPECAAKCMSIKLTEAATWFGQGDISAYCTHTEFLEAYNICLKDHCTHDKDLETGQQAGITACGNVKPTITGSGAAGNSSHAAGTAEGNSTATGGHLSGPANAPTNNATATTTTSPSSTSPAVSGALPSNSATAKLPTTSATATTTGAPSRFSGAVSSAAATAANSSASDMSPHSLGSLTLLVGASSGVVSLIYLL